MELSIPSSDRAPTPPLQAVRIAYPPVTRSLPGPQPHSRWVAPLLLLLITLVGGCFRFYRLTYPPLWNDETLVYWRVCGTYGQMLKPLGDRDAFPPLHYSLYWLVGHFVRLTPFVIRLIPAIFGTLNIPAMYLLARQLLPRRTALLAAAFTACSAFMLFYSRDAKMYPDLYLFVTLNVAFLWRWFRTNRLFDWLCWVAAGCAMVGVHASGLVLLAISPLFLLTQYKVHWAKVLFFLAGMVLIASGPIGFFTKFDAVMNRVEEKGWGEGTGTGWVGPFYNANRTGPQHALLATSAFLIGYEWPKDDYVFPEPEKAIQPIPQAMVDGPETAVLEVMWILTLAALPWPLLFRPLTTSSPQPQWRVVLWLGIWIFLVGYAFYCQSVPGFVSPRRWDYELREWLGPHGIGLVIGLCATFMFLALGTPISRRALVRFFHLLLVIGGLYLGCWIIFLVYFRLSVDAEFSGNPLPSLWEPRYLGFIWPAVGLSVAALLMRLPTRAVRIACISFVLGINLVMAGLRFTIRTEPPIDLLARDVAVSQDPKSPVRTYEFITNGDIAVAGTVIHPDWQMAGPRYFLEMETNRRPMSPDLFIDSFHDYNYRSNPDLGWFKRSIDAAPSPKRIVVWSQVMPWIKQGEPNSVKPDAHDKILLAHGWRLDDEQVYTVRIYWDWRERWKWVRREYRRRAE